MTRVSRRALLCCPALPLLAADEAGERFKRFNEAKFGMFVHWGPYSLASVEASWPIMGQPRWKITEDEYRALPQRFNPVHFDPRAWIRLAKAAGQRYMIFTTKHHDGFCMFDSAYTSYKITRTPYKRDIVKMLAGAAREEQYPLGFYYSPPDMNHPGYRDTSKSSNTNWRGEPERPEWPLYLDYMELQIRELLTRYGDVFAIWFDGLDRQEKYDGTRFHAVIRSLQPRTLINNRIGLTGDFVTPEQRLPKGIPRKGSVVGNTNPADQGLASTPPKPEEFQPWETCMTINGTWGYNKNDHSFKSATDLVRALIDAASKGGNFLLNVGPAPEGTIQPEFEERLRAIGKWLAVNGESIYGTTYGPVQDFPFGRTTAKGRAVYLHIFDWPRGPVELKGLLGKVISARALAGGRPVRFSGAVGGVQFDLTGHIPTEHATVFKIRLA
jgi:alpha-L-fucosidase